MEWMILPYKRYADFSGRSQRMEYWMFTLFTVLVTVVCVAVMIFGGFDLASLADADSVAEEPGSLFYVGLGLFVVFWLGSFIPSIAVNVRRFHDRDMSGWWFLGFSLLSNLPYIGWAIAIANLVIMALPGTSGTNRFGDDPLNPVNLDVFS
jgi:uncharacterized membrane protein YhaH (DUF805 family)